jgi:PKD repeat protein
MRLKKIRQILKYLLPRAVLFCLLLALLPFAIAGANAGGCVVSIDVPAEVAPNSNITARVSILNVTDLDSFQFKLSYNTSVLEVVGAEGTPQVVTDGLIDSTTITDHPWMFSPLHTPGTLYILGNVGGVLGANGDGYLCEVHFHVIASACNTSALNLSDGHLFDTSGTGTEIAATWIGASVHVAAGVVVTGCMADPNPTKVGYNTTFSANATAGTPPYSWDWDFGDGNNSTAVSPVHQYTTANTYTVNVTVTDNMLTQGSCSFNITVNPPLNVTGCQADPNPTKVGHNTTFSATVTGGIGAYTYDWDFGDGSGSAEATPIYAYTTANTYNVTLSVTDERANVESCSFNITVNPELNVSGCMADPNPTEVGHNSTFSANATGGVGAYTWLWDFGDGNNSTQTSPIYAYGSAGNRTVTVTVKDGLNNTQNCSFNISVNEALNVSGCMADPNPTKVDYNTTFSANASGGVGTYTWLWDFGDGNNSTAASPIYAYATAGNRTVTVTVTDQVTSKDCSFNITVNPPLDVTGCMADPNPTRVDYNTTFSATVTGGIGSYTYDWDFGDGNSSAEVSPIYAYASTDTYNVTLTVTDERANVEGCSFNLTVNPPLDVTGCMADPNPTRVDYNTTFSVNITGGLPPYSYDWDFGDGNNSAEASPVYAYAAVGSYNVTINVTDNVTDTDGCAFVITVNPPLNVTNCQAVPNPTKVGYNTTFSANATGGVGTYTWLWHFGDGNVSAEVSPVYAYAGAGNYSVTVDVTDDVGPQSCSFNITVYEALAVDFSADSGIVEAYPDPSVDPVLAYPTSGYVAGTAITANTTFNFSNESTGGVPAYTYAWDFGDGNNSTDENPVHKYTVNATYNVSLTVTDSLVNVETETKAPYLMAYLAGDANHNGVIDMSDVTKVEREILRIDPPTIWADANVDHAVNMADVTTIEWIILLT